MNEYCYNTVTRVVTVSHIVIILYTVHNKIANDLYAVTSYFKTDHVSSYESPRFNATNIYVTKNFL